MTNKYNARKVKESGYTFDSVAEYNRYCQLKLLQAAGEISGLEVHPKFELQPAFKVNGKTELAIMYVADFRYIENGGVVIEDVKGGKATQTRLFQVKRKMLLYRYPGLDFRVVEK